METDKGYNIYNTTFLPTKIMAYFEKHKLLETFQDLLFQIISKKPTNIVNFVLNFLNEFDKNGKILKTLILTSPEINVNQIAFNYSKLFNAPIIQYNNQCNSNFFEQFSKFLRHHNLLSKDLIIFSKHGFNY